MPPNAWYTAQGQVMPTEEQQPEQPAHTTGIAERDTTGAERPSEAHTRLRPPRGWATQTQRGHPHTRPGSQCERHTGTEPGDGRQARLQNSEGAYAPDYSALSRQKAIQNSTTLAA